MVYLINHCCIKYLNDIFNDSMIRVLVHWFIYLFFVPFIHLKQKSRYIYMLSFTLLALHSYVHKMHIWHQKEVERGWTSPHLFISQVWSVQFNFKITLLIPKRNWCWSNSYVIFKSVAVGVDSCRHRYFLHHIWRNLLLKTFCYRLKSDENATCFV